MDEQRMSWDDLRLVLAVAQAGSLAGAARRLGVSHATVFRRLAALEAGLRVRLFERTRSGYAPTPAGDDVAAAAERIQDEVHGVERRVAGRDVRPSGTVRVTTTDTLLAGLLSPVFAAFRHACPDIALDVSVSNAVFDLSKREADVAIRPSSSPPEWLVGRRIGTIAQAVYATPAWRARGEDLAWIGPDPRMGYRQLDQWMRARGADDRCAYRVDTLLGLFAAARAGIGAAVLPCYLADGDRDLVRIGERIDELATDLWLLTHPDLRDTARIRAFLSFVATAVDALQARLAGV
ncbi:LysR family transcriptional regulator [Burkholderia pseudomultivorans]|uniref:LysR family transcriptional regulator n=1 Tax=Burkholderia pseudomultivorans TaxID=1207504 RepID=A0A132E5Q2_9BURK|nr:LysR family transcriptional regulator [Burkholderia pseudomultivorans]KWF16661.1 LysR family transcriptional regulator [Burkholderia pseudomultivorans]